MSFVVMRRVHSPFQQVGAWQFKSASILVGVFWLT